MAKCDLSIELDHAGMTYIGGEKISGTVHVRADKDVNCSGLQVRTYWATHGRGNVDSKEVQAAMLFTGQWVAGEESEYRFELSVADWPPTYHGHHLSVDHYVEARAKIPWGFDPKASVPFRVRPIRESDTLDRRPKAIEIKGPVAALVGIGMAAVFLVFAVIVSANIGWFLLPFLLLVPTGVGLFFVVRFLLPAWALGEVVCNLDAEQVSPGQQVDGELTIQPKKNVSINEITLCLSAQERCVSGSGTNRTTHRHEVFQQSLTVFDATNLRSERKASFPAGDSNTGDRAVFAGIGRQQSDLDRKTCASISHDGRIGAERFHCEWFPPLSPRPGIPPNRAIVNRSSRRPCLQRPSPVKSPSTKPSAICGRPARIAIRRKCWSTP